MAACGREMGGSASRLQTRRGLQEAKEAVKVSHRAFAAIVEDMARRPVLKDPSVRESKEEEASVVEADSLDRSSLVHSFESSQEFSGNSLQASGFLSSVWSVRDTFAHVLSLSLARSLFALSLIRSTPSPPHTTTWMALLRMGTVEP